MKFAFIRAEKASYPIATMCRLFGVTRQGYYAYEKAQRSPKLDAEATLQERIKAIYDEGRGAYGSPRILEALHREGIRVGKRRVERAMVRTVVVAGPGAMRLQERDDCQSNRARARAARLDLFRNLLNYRHNAR